MRVREARQGAIHFEHVTDGDDALRGVRAPAVLDSAEHIAIEAVRWGMSKTQALSEGIDGEEGQAGSVLERGEALVESKAL